MRNQRFGKLTVKWVADRQRKTWECFCDCGRYLTTTEKLLLAGRRVACQKCQPRKANLGLTARLRTTRAGKSFVSARKHCIDPKCVNWPNYGGRGIQFKFANFEEWKLELGRCPNGYFLDRIDPNGHYEKGNVRWVPRWVSAHNKRKWSRGNPKQHSQFRGVWKGITGKKWSALVMKKGERFYLGCFNTEEEAGRAYDKKASMLYGQYAALNFPHSTNSAG